MTIVLNGMPFIKEQYDIIPQIFDEWHIIEGATLPLADTSWCRNIDNKFYTEQKLSVDGTTQFLDTIRDDKKIFVYRKGDFYNGKTEMCNEIMHCMKDCILMQIDVDEIWKVETLKEIFQYCEENEGFDGMLFHCNYYVGENLYIENENCYGNYSQDWCRLWKIKEQTGWRTHEPARIHNLVNFLNRDFTKSKDWIFDHYSYTTQEQLEFKENFYGYTNAVKDWRRLQEVKEFPCKLRDYFSWVHDDAVVNIKNV